MQITNICLALIVLLLHSLDTGLCAFQRETPILWQRQERSDDLRTTTETIALVVEYDTPCDVLYGSDGNHFNQNCKILVRDKFEDRFYELCDVNPSSKRHKRWISFKLSETLNIDFRGCILSINCKVNDDKQILQRFDNLEQLVRNANHELNQKQKKLEESLEISKKHFKIIKEDLIDYVNSEVRKINQNLNRIEGKYERLNISINELNEWKTQFLSKFGHTVTTTAYLSSYFEVNSNNMNEVIRDWSNNKVNAKLFDVLSLSSDRLASDVTSLKPIGCRINSNRKQINFLFKRSVLNTDIAVYKSNSFHFHSTENGRECTLKYTGPEYVIYDSLIHCVLPFNPDNNIITVTADTCKPSPDISVKKYWKKRCDNSYYTEPSDVIQIKSTNDYNYVYCYGYQINVYKANKTCPNYVFKVTKKEKFSLPVKIIPKVSTSIEVHTSEQINHHLMPALHQINFDDFQSEEPITQTTDWILITLLIAVVFFLIVILSVLYFRRRRRSGRLDVSLIVSYVNGSKPFRNRRIAVSDKRYSNDLIDI